MARVTIALRCLLVLLFITGCGKPGDSRESAASKAGSQSSSETFQERRLATIPQDYEVADFVFTRDSQRVAYWASKEKKWFVVEGDKRGDDFSEHGFPPVFSLDGKGVAYVGRSGKKWVVVIDGKKGPEYDWAGPVVFSPDGKQVAHAALTDSGDRKNPNIKWFIVLGDKRIGEDLQLDGAVAPTFSPDCTQLAYVGRKEGQFFIVLGNKKIGEEADLDTVSVPTFSPDGKQLAYAAKRGAKWFVALGEKKLGLEYGINGGVMPAFSPDGQTLAFMARKDNKCFVVVGDRKGPEFDSAGPPAFSTNGKYVAYAAENEGKKFVVVGDVRTEDFDEIGADAFSRIMFSPDGTRVAFGVRKGKELWWVVREIGKMQKLDRT